MDPPCRSLTRVYELSTNQELLVPVAREIGRDAAHSGSRVDREWTRIRQHHDHVASVAIHFDVAGHVAYPYIAVVVMNHQVRVARHMDRVINRDAESVLLRHGDDDAARRKNGTGEAMAVGERRRNRQFLIGAPFGDHTDLFESFPGLLLPPGFVETIRRLGDGDFHFRFVPTFHRQIAIRILQTNSAAWREVHPLRAGYRK